MTNIDYIYCEDNDVLNDELTYLIDNNHISAKSLEFYVKELMIKLDINQCTIQYRIEEENYVTNLEIQL